jgi:hypothetical protein
MAPESLQPGTTHSWDDLGEIFEFKPDYLGAAGGMPVSVSASSVLLITHPGGGRSFDYGDYWDGADLIYTGRGKKGDQPRAGANLDVAENRRTLHAFEGAGPRQLRYLGSPRSVEERTGRALGGDGAMRNVLQFRLRFPESQGRRWASASTHASDSKRRSPGGSPQRVPRPFDPDHRPTASEPSGTQLEPEERLALQEKASVPTMPCSAQALLEAGGWTEIQEIPVALDLWATDPIGGRVIFEAKTIGDRNETTQCRGGLAQLLEYRLEHGSPEDELALVCDRAVSVRRGRLLNAIEVAVVVITSEGCEPGNDRGSALARRITS